MSLSSAAAERFTVRFVPIGAPREPGALQVNVPLLEGVGEETIFPAARATGRCGAFALYEAGDWLLGGATKTVAAGEIESATQALYRDLLAAVGERHLGRVWNYVPQINVEVGGLENYRAFCRGRALAFESAFGPGQFTRLSAASAVGMADDRLTVIFAATRTPTRHVENPEQVAAYRYPAEHGPRAPSFARATVTADGRYVFISGTAAIKGHVTIAPDDTLGQVACTLDNLALISQAAGLGAELGAGTSSHWTRHFKVYLRHAADLAAVKGKLQGSLLQPGDIVTWLQADICRAALNVEIEATLVAK